MKTRREMVKWMAATGICAAGGLRLSAEPAGRAAPAPATGADDRSRWIRHLTTVATPVIDALLRRQLKATMPVEAAKPEARAPYTHLEAVGRLLMGLAPWLELGGDDTPEGRARAEWGERVREAIDAATDPRSPDFVNFASGHQPLVDAAFLSQALQRAPRELWAKLDRRAQANVVAGLKATRKITPSASNWRMFASTIEAGFQRWGEKRDDERLFAGPRSFEQWYVGDGWYGDGPEFHTDYYNAFVIQPMLVEVLDVIAGEADEWRKFAPKVRARLTRFAEIEERLVAPDGSYPVVGRSIAYRCGAFQGLALCALRHQLPERVRPGQARVALTSVIRRTLEAPGTFDAQGWLRIGLAGHQPSLGEVYISTGSLYLCSAAFVPLGLPASDPFWSDPPAPTTWQRTWAGVDMPTDHALREA
ncbi:MAG TPA: DUF2264 domain-containing protein [Opitutaceae bacterium]|nr:DUF2264 domain-containing protein [Opitutaceae bacterium]